MHITKRYLQHILYAKNRDPNDLEERLIITIFLSDIISKGTLVKKLQDRHITFYHLEYSLGSETLSTIIILENKTYTLLSSFVKYKKKPSV